MRLAATKHPQVVRIGDCYPVSLVPSMEGERRGEERRGIREGSERGEGRERGRRREEKEKGRDTHM